MKLAGAISLVYFVLGSMIFLVGCGSGGVSKDELDPVQVDTENSDTMNSQVPAPINQPKSLKEKLMMGMSGTNSIPFPTTEEEGLASLADIPPGIYKLKSVESHIYVQAGTPNLSFMHEIEERGMPSMDNDTWTFAWDWGVAMNRVARVHLNMPLQLNALSSTANFSEMRSYFHEWSITEFTDPMEQATWYASDDESSNGIMFYEFIKNGEMMDDMSYVGYSNNESVMGASKIQVGSNMVYIYSHYLAEGDSIGIWIKAAYEFGL